jgi:Na+-driven multidrug efflux pump
MKYIFSRGMHRLQLRESWIIFFIMGIIMMTFPFLHIFNKPVTLFGFPLMFIYFTAGWAFSIFVIYIFMRAFTSNSPASDKKKEP